MKLITQLLIAAILVIGTPAMALEIGLVDVQVLLKNSSERIEAERRIEKEFKPRQDALNKKQDEIKAMVQELNKQRLTLKAQEINKREDEIKILQVKLQEDARKAQQEFNRRQSVENESIRLIIGKAIDKVAYESKLDFVFYKDAVAWERIDNDITSKVLQLMKEENN